MKKVKSFAAISLSLCIIISGCNKKSTNSATDKPSDNSSAFVSTMTQEEKDSIKVGNLSPENEYYDEVVNFDPDCKNYIKEISIYDKEINDTFTVHVSLPPNYDENKEYPLVLMTDGVWRLSDHPELRVLMKNKEIEDIILVSVGYPHGYDYRSIRVRDLVKKPDDYLHFLCDNLMPYLIEQYSVDKQRLTLTGHSYGGYWAFYSLFHSDTISKNMFKNYYIGSPSVQASTNGKFLENFEMEYYKRNKSINCNVYVCVGEKEESAFQYMISQFVDTVKEHNYKGLNLKFETIPDYDHNTVFKPSIQNALKMFYGTK